MKMYKRIKGSVKTNACPTPNFQIEKYISELGAFFNWTIHNKVYKVQNKVQLILWLHSIFIYNITNFCYDNLIAELLIVFSYVTKPFRKYKFNNT